MDNTETADHRAARIVYASPDGGDLTREEIGYGPCISCAQEPAPAPFKAMTYSFDVCGVASARGWAFFNNRIEYEVRQQDQCARFDNHGVYRFDWFRVNMPYTIVKIREDIHPRLYLPLNREYKPLGIPRSEFVNYDAYPHKAMRFTRNPTTFKDVWVNDHLYLYNDGNRDDYPGYFRRLANLFRYKVTA